MDFLQGAHLSPLFRFALFLKFNCWSNTDVYRRDLGPLVRNVEEERKGLDSDKDAEEGEANYI